MAERIAVVIPCYNEALTIAKVIEDFRTQLPDSRIVVFDNNSTDGSADIASRHGAEVIPVLRQGKGYVIARMLERIDADYFIMADGDDTYPAEEVQKLLEPLRRQQADMTVGTRLQVFSDKAFRPLHVMGNRLVRGLINRIFDANLTDIMSGYRGFTGDLARTVPVISIGFEVETEMTLQTLYHGHTIVEVPGPYRERPEGSFSKLNTFRDGARVLVTIFNIFRSFKPLTFFGLIAIFMALLAVLAALPGIYDYLDHGEVNHFPLLFVGVGCAIISFISLTVGVVLHAMNVRIKEITSLMRKMTFRRRR
jgi:glycosyltransferase involved in cell wall biosynthesis